MQLDEFKLLWNNSISTDKKAGVQGNELDLIMVNTLEKLNQLARTSRFWRIVSAVGVGLVFTFLAVTAGLYMRYPEQLKSLINGLPALILLPSFVTVVGLLYYKQAEIFEIYNCNSLSNALRQAIARFKMWYRLSVVCFAIFLSPVYYLLIIGVSYKFDITLSPTFNFIFCISLTILTLLLNHLHYRRTYFHWLSQLRNNLDELADSTK